MTFFLMKDSDTNLEIAIDIVRYVYRFRKGHDRQLTTDN
jgi:hypothetical protein